MPSQVFSITAASQDGGGQYTDTSWPPNGGTWEDFSDDFVNVSKQFFTPNYFQSLAFLRFDTSSLPDDALVTEANLSLYVIEISSPEAYALVGDYYDFGGEPTVAGDWIESASPSIFDPKLIGEMGTPGIYTFSLTDLPSISTTGITGIRLTLGPYQTNPLGDNHVTIANFEHVEQAPQLEVIFTEAATITVHRFKRGSLKVSW